MTTIVQQIDTQGPAVVERITTQFTDVACSADNARKLVEALHGGTSVTLSANGKTATFTPTAKLGYGEAYIALALAAEALRSAGVTGCATPEQWQAVLMGGPLVAAGTTSTTTTRSASASSSSNFPGILTLHSQGQGWGQIAQTTNVELGQIVSNAQSSFNMKATSDSSLTPTGRDSSYSPSGRDSGDKPGADHSSRDNHPGRSEGAPYGKAYGHDKDKDKPDHDKPGKGNQDTSDNETGSSKANR